MLIMVSGPDQSNGLNVLDSDDESLSSYCPILYGGIYSIIRIFHSLGDLIMQSHTPPKYIAVITIFISLCIKFKY